MLAGSCRHIAAALPSLLKSPGEYHAFALSQPLQNINMGNFTARPFKPVSYTPPPIVIQTSLEGPPPGSRNGPAALEHF